MKKYLFFAGLACVAFGFVGCGSDDDGGSSKTPITLTEGSTAEESVFVTLTDGGKEEFLSYDDEESVAEKVRYASEKNLLGVMYWEHGSDPTRKLLRAMSEEKRKL